MKVNIIATVGTSPEILTEFLWILKNQNLQVGKVFCVGTQKSVQEFTNSLVLPNIRKNTSSGALVRLREALNMPKNWPEVTWAGQVEIDDVRSQSDALLLDRACRMAVLEAQAAEANTPVYACISGGRKTMSASLMQAVSLLGRDQDKAYHVLVRSMTRDLDEQAITGSAFAFPGDPAFNRSHEVELDLIEAPIIRLRDVLEQENISLTNDKIINRLQSILELPTLSLDVVTGAIYLKRGGKFTKLKIKLTPMERLLMGASIIAKQPATVETLCNNAILIMEQWWEKSAQSPLLEPAEVKTKFNKIAPTGSKLREKITSSMLEFDPRLVSFFEFQRGHNKGTKGPRELGFSAKACEKLTIEKVQSPHQP